MTAALISPPATEPVLLAEAKAHLKVEIADDDDLIGALITAARVHVEAATRRVLITQSWRIYRDDWPDSGEIALPVTPLQSVDEVIVYDSVGEPVTLSAAKYQVDIASIPARLRLKASPATVKPGEPLNGIEIDVTAGYGASGVAVPQPLRLAIMVLVARWYEFRDATAIGTVPASVAPGFEALIAPYRVLRLT
ncbi:MAG: head-tail connector protein [Ancalomicrobiaceae bacterium]|nr:head-tail connector protein [Ancalomicrobiaceae bacterium]